jgi:putative nucleotidyltransferase with HDIG domain
MIGQRLRQFREANDPPTAADLALVRDVLPTPLFNRFQEQHPRDMRHGARTAQWLLDRGHADHDLLVAALLHDIGKGHQRRVDRAAYVAASWLGLAPALATPASRCALRQALARSLDHAITGARELRALGAPPRAVELTLFHHAKLPGDPVLALLQQADAAC